MRKTVSRLVWTAFAVCGMSASAALYSTSFDSPDFVAGNLDTQDGWAAQAQWQADGAGNVYNTVGAFVRAHNTDVLGTTAVGEVMTITSVLTLGAYSTPSTDIANWEEGIYAHAMSHQQGSQAFSAGLAVQLSYKVSTGNLELRAAQGVNEAGTTVVSIGAASGLGGTTYTLMTEFTKTAADTWAVVAILDDGINPSYLLSYTANGETADLDTDSDGGGILGGFQGLPSGGGSGGVATAPFGSTRVHDYSLEVIPEPATIGLLGLSGLLIYIRRKCMK